MVKPEEGKATVPTLRRWTMKRIKICDLRPFDILLYKRRKFWVKYYHAAWYVGRVWGMNINYEATFRGPEMEEWHKGDPPTYVCRLKEKLRIHERVKIMEMCKKLKDRKYDFLYLFGYFLGVGHHLRIRCDELIEKPLKYAGIDPKRKILRPEGFLTSPVMDAYSILVPYREGTHEIS